MRLAPGRVKLIGGGRRVQTAECEKRDRREPQTATESEFKHIQTDLQQNDRSQSRCEGDPTKGSSQSLGAEWPEDKTCNQQHIGEESRGAGDQLKPAQVGIVRTGECLRTLGEPVPEDEEADEGKGRRGPTGRWSTPLNVSGEVQRREAEKNRTDVNQPTTHVGDISF